MFIRLDLSSDLLDTFNRQTLHFLAEQSITGNAIHEIHTTLNPKLLYADFFPEILNIKY